jgi:DNA processing protein
MGGPKPLSAEEAEAAGEGIDLWDEIDLPGFGRAPQTRRLPFEAEEDASPRAVAVVDLLGPAPIQVDELVRQSGLAARTVQMTLLELEIAGRLERHGGNAVSLIAGR